MLEKIKQLFKLSSEVGLKLPFMHDPVRNQPSVTLLFVYITFFMSAGSTFALNFTDKTLQAAITSICFWCLSFVFYRLRRLDSFKIDLDDKSIELKGNENDEKS